MDEDFAYKDTILKVKCDRDIDEFIKKFIVEKRQELDGYIARDAQFRISFDPVAIKKDAPKIARDMAEAAKQAGVGPMAAVAGAVSEHLVEAAKKKGVNWIIAENGGDISLYGDREFTISIYAGKSPLSGKMGFSLNPAELDPATKTYGVCTSSASVGPSISLGKSDAVTVFAPSATVADAFATAIGNSVNEVEDGLKFAKRFVGKEIDGVAIIKGDRVGTLGRVPKIVKLV